MHWHGASVDPDYETDHDGPPPDRSVGNGGPHLHATGAGRPDGAEGRPLPGFSIHLTKPLNVNSLDDALRQASTRSRPMDGH
jgi:hypothetical protein